MDVQLQELIDKIKKAGVDSADKKAAQIEAEAEKKAEEIIADAEKRAEDIIKKAKAESEKFEQVSEEAIVQAGRNMLLSFRESLIAELNVIVQEKTEKSLSKDVLSKLIPDVVKAWCKNCDASELSVLLSEKDLKTLSSNFKTQLKAQISKGLEIKADKTLSAGFRIGVKNGQAFYDYSAESLAQMFSAYLNPKVSELLQKAAKEVK
ncbi:MAG: V-type ATP synthase subunit E [Treponema sp.]|nr:V-type ATP synthase subunit E [Treponema sp.]